MAEIEEVRGKDITIRFETARCIHARHCVLTHPDVFVPNAEGEWIHPDAASAEAVAALALNCPSGAITYERRDGINEEAPLVNTARLRENGPVALHAPLTIAGVAAGFRATLCRCGASQRKPYCDGSHTAAGFVATGEPKGQESAALAARDGALTVTPTKNGPLQVTGNLEIVSGTGRTLDRTTETWLCRCGGSQNKPYCDGSHRKVGFTAP
ncbi:MAG TPA: CDGSH iron-sulfur domain-containing protein [Stellaceae bacterium]|nr:CDGSH iron-sulfur domain-containing protein [Stellaceae bacterium]